MIALLTQHQAQIADLCRRFGVRKLEVFGSAATDGFDPQTSDVDLLVEYGPGADLGPWLTRYFELRSALEQLLCRPVDLVMAGAPRNPRFVAEVNRTRRLLYAA